jgi:hypothetical protein
VGRGVFSVVAESGVVLVSSSPVGPGERVDLASAWFVVDRSSGETRRGNSGTVTGIRSALSFFLQRRCGLASG